MKIKSYILLLMHFIFSNFVFCQTNTENLDKYWNYKNRLKYYVNPISSNTINNTGEGLIMTARNYNAEDDPNLGPVYASYGQQNISLGYYIGVLASEYKLFMDNGQTADAYKTLDKLDKELDVLIRKDNKC